jgi:hypothetical protein
MRVVPGPLTSWAAGNCEASQRVDMPVLRREGAGRAEGARAKIKYLQAVCAERGQCGVGNADGDLIQQSQPTRASPCRLLNPAYSREPSLLPGKLGSPCQLLTCSPCLRCG